MKLQHFHQASADCGCKVLARGCIVPPLPVRPCRQAQPTASRVPSSKPQPQSSVVAAAAANRGQGTVSRGSHVSGLSPETATEGMRWLAGWVSSQYMGMGKSAEDAMPELRRRGVVCSDASNGRIMFKVSGQDSPLDGPGVIRMLRLKARPGVKLTEPAPPASLVSSMPAPRALSPNGSPSNSPRSTSPSREYQSGRLPDSPDALAMRWLSEWIASHYTGMGKQPEDVLPELRRRGVVYSSIKEGRLMFRVPGVMSRVEASQIIYMLRLQPRPGMRPEDPEPPRSLVAKLAETSRSQDTTPLRGSSPSASRGTSPNRYSSPSRTRAQTTLSPEAAALGMRWLAIFVSSQYSGMGRSAEDALPELKAQGVVCSSVRDGRPLFIVPGNEGEVDAQEVVKVLRLEVRPGVRPRVPSPPPALRAERGDAGMSVAQPAMDRAPKASVDDGMRWLASWVATNYSGMGKTTDDALPELRQRGVVCSSIKGTTPMFKLPGQASEVEGARVIQALRLQARPGVDPLKPIPPPGLTLGTSPTLKSASTRSPLPPVKRPSARQSTSSTAGTHAPSQATPKDEPKGPPLPNPFAPLGSFFSNMGPLVLPAATTLLVAATIGSASFMLENIGKTGTFFNSEQKANKPAMGMRPSNAGPPPSFAQQSAPPAIGEPKPRELSREQQLKVLQEQEQRRVEQEFRDRELRIQQEQERLRVEKELKEQKEQELRQKQQLEKEQEEREQQEREQKEKEERDRVQRRRIAQQEKERQEEEMQEKQRLERERQEREKQERERVERERRERLEKEQQERERVERERQERFRQERERQERERQEKVRLERERVEREKQERERLERERQEKVRMERERVEREKQERERLEMERQEKARLERERVEREKQERERLERERQEKAKLEREKQEKERVERERREKEQQERERLERERQEKARLEREKQEKERVERERKEKEQQERERLERERQENVKLERERLEREKQERARVERERQEKAQQEKERVEQERQEKERMEREKQARAQQEKDRVEKEQQRKAQLEMERLEKEKQEKTQAELREKEQQAKEQREMELRRKEQMAKEAREREQQAREQSLRDQRMRVQQQEAELREKMQRDKQQAEQAQREKEVKEREAREKEQRERGLREMEQREREQKEKEQRDKEQRERQLQLQAQQQQQLEQQQQAQQKEEPKSAAAVAPAGPPAPPPSAPVQPRGLLQQRPSGVQPLNPGGSQYGGPPTLGYQPPAQGGVIPRPSEPYYDPTQPRGVQPLPGRSGGESQPSRSQGEKVEPPNQPKGLLPDLPEEPKMDGAQARDTSLPSMSIRGPGEAPRKLPLLGQQQELQGRQDPRDRWGTRDNSERVEDGSGGREEDLAMDMPMIPNPTRGGGIGQNGAVEGYEACIYRSYGC